MNQDDAPQVTRLEGEKGCLALSVTGSGEQPKFDIGDIVRKVGGNYEATGTIVSVFWTLAGKVRYVFEFAAYPGMLHIFNGSQLERCQERSRQQTLVRGATPE